MDDKDGHSCTDEESEEIRKTSRLEKETLDEQSKLEKLDNIGSGKEYDNCYESGHLDDVSSEEYEGDVCYANSPASRRGKSVNGLMLTHMKKILN